MSVFGVFLVRIFPHSDWRKDTEYLSVFSSNAGKYGPEKYLKRTLSMQCMAILTNTFLVFYILLFCSPKGSWNKLQNLRIWENISHIALGNHCVKSTRIVLVRMPENAGRNNSGYRHFLRSDRAITSSDI